MAAPAPTQAAAVAAAADPARRRADARTITMVGLAHGTSHFFHMLLPPMFPWLLPAFGLSFAQAGMLVTAFFVVSGIGQALAGFLVDRVGARPVLAAAFASFAASALAAATAQGFEGLLLAAMLAGLGNAPFHPIDFTILNQRIASPRLPHAYSIHGVSGNLGWALAPVVLTGIVGLTGDWRMGYWVVLGMVLLVALLLWTQRDALDDRLGLRSEAGSRATAGGGAPAGEHPMAFLRLPSVWLCFAFFFWTTVALAAIQSFASPALNVMTGLPLTVTAYVVTGYMVCGAIGMLLGGFLTHRVARLETLIAACLLGSGLVLLVVATGWLPGPLALAVTALAGFGTGLAGPSRDMLIRRAAPPGATGRVYGTVYSGLDIGFALAAPLLGALMDRGHPNAIFVASAIALACAVGSAALVGRGLAPRAAIGAVAGA